MSDLKLDWGAAEVKDGTLNIGVEGEAPSGWGNSFERAVKLLQGGGGDWGEVKLKKMRVSVEGVSPGSEEKLHHFLEAVIQQVNADHEQSLEESAKGARDGSTPDEVGPDGKMTARFREFETEPQ